MTELKWLENDGKTFEDWIKDPDFQKKYLEMQRHFAQLDYDRLMLQNRTVIRDLTEPINL